MAGMVGEGANNFSRKVNGPKPVRQIKAMINRKGLINLIVTSHSVILVKELPASFGIVGDIR